MVAFSFSLWPSSDEYTTNIYLHIFILDIIFVEHLNPYHVWIKAARTRLSKQFFFSSFIPIFLCTLRVMCLKNEIYIYICMNKCVRHTRKQYKRTNSVCYRPRTKRSKSKTTSATEKKKNYSMFDCANGTSKQY